MLSQSSRQSLEQAAAKYQEALFQHAAAHLYLEGRGITADVAAMFRLGYVDEPVLGDEQYVGRLSIPYITPSGVIDIRYRALGAGEPKYMSRPGVSGHLYNVTALQTDSDVIALCEGEMDTIITNSRAGIPALGVPGANAWKPHFARVLGDYQRIVLLCDGDQPGRDWGKRIAQTLENAVVVSMPDGMDVNEVFLREGADSIRKRAGL